MTDWTTDAAEALAAEIWGITGRARALDAERDANFRIDPIGGGAAQVLKITHPDEDPAVAAFQTEALVHARLADPSLPVPQVMPTRASAAWHRLDGPRPRIARMVGWLDGQPMASASAAPVFRERLGALIARLDLALAGFATKAPRHEFVWDLSQAASLRDMLHHVPDADARALAARALDRFAAEIAPRLPGLRRQVIHNDMNPHNVLVDPAAPDEAAAIIDFGDMVEGPLINELAIALAYQPPGSSDLLGPATEVAAGYARVLPLRPEEIELLPGLIAARRATTIVVASWRAAAHPGNRDYLLRSWTGALVGLAALEDLPEGAATARFATACTIEGSPRMSMANAFDPQAAGTLPAGDRALIDRRAAAMGAAYRLFYAEPLHLVRGEGVWLWDAEGRRYLDAYNNVASVGHCHPRVVAALSGQAAILNTHTRYLHPLVVDYAERLLATAPAPLGNAMFTCTGSEANDLAIRIARTVTEAQGVIVTSYAYHGVTETLAGMSPALGPHVAPGPLVRTVPPPDPSAPDCAERFAADVRAAAADLSAAGLGTAALMVDTIFASDGILPDPPGTLAAAADAVRAAGGLFIADEVQAGFHRTGGMWGFARHGIVPDIVSMGKPMGNGHPVAGILARPDLVEAFGRDIRYFNTFGGSPVSAAVGLAVLDVLQDEDLGANADTTGGRLADALREMTTQHPGLGDVRAAGLYLGVDVITPDGAPDPARAGAVVNGLRRRGVLISAAGPHGHVLKIRPPLPFGPDHADLLVAALDDTLNAEMSR